MSGFAQLDAYLAEPFSIDYWSDDAIGHAQELVGRLSDDDWVALESAWRERSAEWKARAAQVLPHGTPGHAIPVLLEMAGEADDEVAEAAADSLRELASPEAPLEVPAALLERIDRLAAAQPGPVARAIADLRRRIRVTG